MSREEILEYFKDINHAYNDCTRYDTLKRMIDELQEPCTDVINREELLKAIDTWDKFGYTETGCFVREPKGDYVPYIHYDDVINCIKGMPSVTPAEKVGHWEWVQYDSNPNIGNWHCSECRTIIPHMPEETDNTPIYKWCPMCGSRMM